VLLRLHFSIGRKKYGGLGIPELRKLRQLEEENVHLIKLVADLSLDKQMLQYIIKKWCKITLQERNGKLDG
jgi:putative transposase